MLVWHIWRVGATKSSEDLGTVWTPLNIVTQTETPTQNNRKG